MSTFNQKRKWCQKNYRYIVNLKYNGKLKGKIRSKTRSNEKKNNKKIPQIRQIGSKYWRKKGSIEVITINIQPFLESNEPPTTNYIYIIWYSSKIEKINKERDILVWIFHLSTFLNYPIFGLGFSNLKLLYMKYILNRKMLYSLSPLLD